MLAIYTAIDMISMNIDSNILHPLPPLEYLDSSSSQEVSKLGFSEKCKIMPMNEPARLTWYDNEIGYTNTLIEYFIKARRLF